MSIDVLKRLFEEHFHEPAQRVIPLQGELGGSGRQITRLTGTRARAIGILYNVLEEDFGDTTLFEFLSKHRSGTVIAPPVVNAYRKVVEVLPKFQIEAGRDLNYSVCYPRGSFD